MKTQSPHCVAAQLRRAIYAGIRLAIDGSPERIARAVVVQVLAQMAAEQAELVAHETARGPGAA
jgi:hypothetical protein